jgi:hypothetical protein
MQGNQGECVISVWPECEEKIIKLVRQFRLPGAEQKSYFP